MKKGSGILWLGVGIAAILIVDMYFKKKQSESKTPLPNVPDSPLPPSGDGVPSDIGKNALALQDGTKVRYSARVNDGTINNIVGILRKDEPAGVVLRYAKGSDGYTWYMVKRDSNYDCPYSTCGITIPRVGGWIRKDVIKLA